MVQLEPALVTWFEIFPKFFPFFFIFPLVIAEIQLVSTEPTNRLIKFDFSRPKTHIALLPVEPFLCISLHSWNFICCVNGVRQSCCICEKSRKLHPYNYTCAKAFPGSFTIRMIPLGNFNRISSTLRCNGRRSLFAADFFPLNAIVHLSAHTRDSI